MLRFACFSLILAGLWCSPALAAGHAFSDNFSVLTPRRGSPAEAQAYAEKVLQQAEAFRRELALEWFGAELTRGKGRTIINVSFSQEDSALTWPIDGSRRDCHMLYLSMSPEAATANSLKHEMVHVLLATHFPHPARLPAWLEEGIASRYDDPQRINHRRELISQLIRHGEKPDLESLLNNRHITPGSDASYALSESLVAFLLDQGDKAQLMKFAKDVVSHGVTKALQGHYEIDSIEQLERHWQSWLTTQRFERSNVMARR